MTATTDLLDLTLLTLMTSMTIKGEHKKNNQDTFLVAEGLIINNYRTAMLYHSLEVLWCQLQDNWTTSVRLILFEIYLKMVEEKK